MSTLAAVMTGTGTGAISTIQIFGVSSEAIIKKVFKPAGIKLSQFKTGRILLGTLIDGAEVIDQVTIGREGPDTFAINCHGNPLIVEMIMQLLKRNGVALLTAEQLLERILTAKKSAGLIAVEANLAQAKARTLQGTKIIMNQINAGLTEKAKGWLENIDDIPIETIKAEAIAILQKSQAAKLIIYGCTAVLAGPPNSGKSTLLNRLAGRQKAIVTDIKGTTRDWIAAQCHIGPLALELIDTAGLDEGFLGPEDTVEKAAQEKTVEIIKRADLVLLILDNSRPTDRLDANLIEKIAGKRVIAVLNKSDLPPKFDISRLPGTLSNTVQISAKEGTGIDRLSEEIIEITGASNFDLRQPICFTSRQENLLKKLTNVKSKQQTDPIITELLKGPVVRLAPDYLG